MNTKTTLPITARRFLLGLLLTLAAWTSTAADYGPWKKWDGWKGFEYRVKRERDDYDGKYAWWIQVRNNYGKTAHLNVALTRPGESMSGEGRLSIRSGGTDNYWKLVADPNRVSTWISKVRFGEDFGPYASPDDKD